MNSLAILLLLLLLMVNCASTHVVEDKSFTEINHLLKLSKISKESMIPKKIHLIWIGSETIPEYISIYRESFETHAPNYSYRLWQNKDLTPENFPITFKYIEKAVAVGIQKFGADPTMWRNSSRRKLAQITDLMRLEIIYRHGGMYLDAKAELLKSPDSMLEKGTYKVMSNEAYCEANCKHHGKKFISNAFFGAIPKHPGIEYLLSQAMLSKIDFESDKVNQETGPYYFGQIGLESKYLKFVPSEQIYPYLSWRVLGRKIEKDKCISDQKSAFDGYGKKIMHKGKPLYLDFPCTRYSANGFMIMHVELGKTWHA